MLWVNQCLSKITNLGQNDLLVLLILGLPLFIRQRFNAHLNSHATFKASEESQKGPLQFRVKLRLTRLRQSGLIADLLNAFRYRILY